MAKAAAEFKAREAEYNNWIQNYWNKLSSDEQQARKAEKTSMDDWLKQQQENLKDAQKLAEQNYKKRTQLISNYEDRLKEDEQFYKQYISNLQNLIENAVSYYSIKIDLTIDTGDAIRSYQEFERTWDKWLKKGHQVKTLTQDIIDTSKEAAENVKTYFKSGEIDTLASNIKKLQGNLKKLQKYEQAAEKGDLSYHSVYANFGVSKQDWNNLKDEDKKSLIQQMVGQVNEELKDQLDKFKNVFLDIAKQVEDAWDKYVEAIDNANDRMNKVVQQHQRVNDLLGHNVRLVELLYGEKAYASLEKYYDLQAQNNNQAIDLLQKQKAYWQKQLNKVEPGTELWQKIRDQIDNIDDQINSKVEENIELLGTQLENRLNKAIESTNLKLTNGRGMDYVDEEWDFIQQYDDEFLDPVERYMGQEDVERAYRKAASEAMGNPKEQQRINNLMKQQLGILKDKDKLTQYDLDRAKAVLEVEKARMALEDSRNNKTKMRLRRDSQGNYTYQYVADEDKLSDLQQALADAQNNLYNLDKEKYKDNLNKMHDTYKDYVQRMKALTLQLSQAQDEEEKKRIQSRMELLKESYDKYWSGLDQTNKQALANLSSSALLAVGQDPNLMTSQQTFKFIQDNVPGVSSSLQGLVDNINGEGGLTTAMAGMGKSFEDALSKYQKGIDKTLKKAKTSTAEIKDVVDSNGGILSNAIRQAEELTTQYQTWATEAQKAVKIVKKAYEDLVKYLDSAGLEKYNDLITNATNVTNSINGSNVTVGSSNVTVGSSSVKRTSLQQWQKDMTDDILAYQKYISKMQSYATNYNNAKTREEKQKWANKIQELYSNESGLYSGLSDYVNSGAKGISNAAKKTFNQSRQLEQDIIKSVTENTTYNTNQDIKITANFPNVSSSGEIKKAINEITNSVEQQKSVPKAKKTNK